MFIQVDLNMGSARYFPEGPFRQAEARRSVKMFHVPKDVGAAVVDSLVPDFLVTDSMVARYLEIRPPQFRITTSFDLIISEIERTFVLGQFFAALAASVVTIERMPAIDTRVCYTPAPFLFASNPLLHPLPFDGGSAFVSTPISFRTSGNC